MVGHDQAPLFDAAHWPTTTVSNPGRRAQILPSPAAAMMPTEVLVGDKDDRTHSGVRIH